VFTGVEADGDGFRFLNGGAAEHDEGYLIMGIDLRGPGAGRAFYFYNDADDVTLCDVALDNFRVGVHVAGNQPPATGSDGKHDRIVLRSSRVTNNTEQGWLGGCDGCAIEHSYFENNGFAQPVFLHNIYMGPGKGQRIVGNELYKSAVINGQCRAVSLVVHGIVEDLLIEDNLVREDPGTAGNGCWGIIVDAGYDTAETFKNVRIARNTVLHYGGVSIGVNACQDCVIENNVVVNNSYGGTHISVPDRPREAGDAEIERVTVRNNTVAIGGTSNGRGIALGGEGNGHVSVSNVVVYTGSDPNWQCASYSGAPARFATLSHNLCYGPSDPPVLDANYRPLPGSPLLGAGHPSLSAQVDRTGATRPAPPAVGAFEASP
jgi:hypothetical protein